MAVVVPIRPKGPKETDAQLVTRALDGARDAQAHLYRRHVRMARGLAHRLLGGPGVDDLIQDAFVTAFERLHTLKERQAFAQWLGTIVVFTARKSIRDQKRARMHSPPDPTTLVAQSTPPDARLELESLYSILNSLPEDVRIALVLRT